MKIVVSGLGNTGQQVVERLLTRIETDELQVYDPDVKKVKAVVAGVQRLESPLLGLTANPTDPAVAVLCGPTRSQMGLARSAVEQGVNVVSISDHPDDINSLLSLDSVAVENDVVVLAGAGFCPGLSDLLVGYGVEQLDVVHEISVASTGTGGPACARQHHWALKNAGLEWANGLWELRRGMSGRDLVWFPDPIGASDCYRAALASPLLLQKAFPKTQRIGARMSANRRDRLTGWLPMLRSPHADGGPGAIRAEIRGRLDGEVVTLIYGVADHPSAAAATIAARCARHMAERERFPAGAYGLASIGDPSEFLAELHADGVRISSFDGYLQVNRNTHQ